MPISSARKTREKLLKNFIEKFCSGSLGQEILNRALTHSSYAKEKKLGHVSSYERLEFLGDAVLKTSISEFLFKNFPDSKEGELTQFRALIVSDKVLSDFARKIELGKLILLGEGEAKQGGSNKNSILACAFEALLGAVFLESGLQAVNTFIFSNFQNEISELIKTSEFSNSKAILQEYTQSQTNELPAYETIEETGDAHNKTFKVQVSYKGKILAFGQGKSKKEAQQNGAKNALIKLGVINE